MRTYSHAALGWAVARLADRSGGRAAAWGAAGGVLPDLPTVAGAAWIGLRRLPVDRAGLRERVCSRRVFAGSNAALHSALSVAVLAPISRSPGLRGPLSALLMGWAGHVLADAFTHADDARPVLWPVSRWRFRSPVSYWDRSRHARAFTVIEHGALLLLGAWSISCRLPRRG